jgi:5-methylcytosine-specific restriction enzyme subunit McrC
MTAQAVPSVRLAEWERDDAHGARLTDSDRVFAETLRKRGQLELTDIASGVRVEAGGHVGVVRLRTLSVTVEPRLLDGHGNLIRLVDFVGGLGLMRRLRQRADFDIEGVDLFDLVAWLLADACDEVLRAGVHADYLPRHEELATIRGRLDIRAQVLRHWGRVDRVVCDFDERAYEVPENRWLLRALTVALRGVRTPHIITLVKRSLEAWQELCHDDRSEPLDWPELTRQTAHYNSALALARTVYEGHAVSNLLVSGRAAGFSFLLDMPRLFEDFVATVLEQAFEGKPVAVQRQPRERSILWDPDANRSYGHVRPDVLLRDMDGWCLPVDAKYKNYAQARLQSADLYQGAVYALSLASPGADGIRRTVMLYPRPADMPPQSRRAS